VKLTTHLNLAPKLITSGNIRIFLHTPSWLAHGRFTFTLIKNIQNKFSGVLKSLVSVNLVIDVGQIVPVLI
jgi:hypothetical protein